MGWRMCLVIGVAGCGRISFDPSADARADSDAALRTCAWTSNPTVGPVVTHTELNTGNQEADPLLVRGDPLTMYFTRSAPNSDIYVAHRSSTGALFDPPQPVAEFSTPAVTELAVQVDTSGHGYYVRSTTSGNADIFEIQRTGGVFTEVRHITELDSGTDEFDPVSSADDLTLWFTAGSPSSQHIYEASRASTADLWSAPVPFAHDGGGLDAAASLTGDGLLITWTSTPVDGMEQDIYFAVRATTADAWGPAQVLAPGVISTTANELEPSIREDGCELFFARSAAPTDPNWDIYSVTLQ